MSLLARSKPYSTIRTDQAACARCGIVRFVNVQRGDNKKNTWCRDCIYVEGRKK